MILLLMPNLFTLDTFVMDFVIMLCNKYKVEKATLLSLIYLTITMVMILAVVFPV